MGRKFGQVTRLLARGLEKMRHAQKSSNGCGEAVEVEPPFVGDLLRAKGDATMIHTPPSQTKHLPSHGPAPCLLSASHVYTAGLGAGPRSASGMTEEWWCAIFHAPSSSTYTNEYRPRTTSPVAPMVNS